jgi:hypothetical protein
MLSKSTILQELSSAKIAHMRWVKRADHLISGLPVDKEFIPLESTTCGFGKWLYGEVGQKLRLEEEFKSIIEQIEFHHDNLHDVYGEIYKIFFVMPEQRSLLHKIITFNSKKVSEKEKMRAKEYFHSLQKSSTDLIGLLEKLESMVKDSEEISRQHHTRLMRRA